jgi:hypothetical protein
MAHVPDWLPVRPWLAAAVERHGLDGLQIHPVPAPPQAPDKDKTMFLGIAMLTIRPPPESTPASARACRTQDGRCYRTRSTDSLFLRRPWPALYRPPIDASGGVEVGIFAGDDENSYLPFDIL